MTERILGYVFTEAGVERSFLTVKKSIGFSMHSARLQILRIHHAVSLSHTAMLQCQYVKVHLFLKHRLVTPLIPIRRRVLLWSDTSGNMKRKSIHEYLLTYDKPFYSLVRLLALFPYPNSKKLTGRTSTLSLSLLFCTNPWPKPILHKRVSDLRKNT